VESNLMSRQELIEKAKISETLLVQWETQKLLKPSGMTEDQTPLYTMQALAQANNIKKFQEMGYGTEEIQKIIKKVGLPKKHNLGRENSLNNHLTVGSLAEKVGVSARTIKHWEDKGIIEADMRSDGGFRLYPQIYVYLCKLVIDLQLFGYTLEDIKTISDLFRTFLAINSDIETFTRAKSQQQLDTMCKEIDRLSEKMALLKEGIVRWEDLINKKRKEINNLKKKNQKREP